MNDVETRQCVSQVPAVLNQDAFLDEVLRVAPAGGSLTTDGPSFGSPEMVIKFSRRSSGQNGYSTRKFLLKHCDP
jgi:hypothetical protein